MPISFDWLETISNLPGKPIPAEWIATKGKNVKVAFADTGVNLGLACLSHLNVPGHKFFTGTPNFSVGATTGQDAVGESFGTLGPGHGTLYASLLAGRTPQAAFADKDAVLGIARDAEYFIIKATNANGQQTRIRHLLDALKLSANLGVEVFITGQCVSRADMQSGTPVTDDEIDAVFDLVKSKNMLVFAPLKNSKSADFWPKITFDNFPSHRHEVFNVTAFPEAFLQVADFIPTQNIPFLLSGFHGKVISRTGLPLEVGPLDASDVEFFNSCAVSIMGGIAVLALSHFKTQHGTLPSREQFAQLLQDRVLPLEKALENFDRPAFFKNF